MTVPTADVVERRVRARVNAYMQGVTDAINRTVAPATLVGDEDYQRGHADADVATRELRGRLRDKALGQIAAAELAFAAVP